MRLASRFSERALAGHPPRRLGAWRFETEPADHGALVVHGRQARRTPGA